MLGGVAMVWLGAGLAAGAQEGEDFRLQPRDEWPAGAGGAGPPSPYILYGPHGYHTFPHSRCQEVPTAEVWPEVSAETDLQFCFIRSLFMMYSRLPWTRSKATGFCRSTSTGRLVIQRCSSTPAWVTAMTGSRPEPTSPTSAQSLASPSCPISPLREQTAKLINAGISDGWLGVGRLVVDDA